jgi:Fe-S-cluster-containing dehydrogenase component/formate-dependent nitrite reductase membrane component NrfD
VQLGFVIDHSRCIGCHACTVACKSENNVPVGAFRTWVKYTEQGSFPTVRRDFAVLRCNQCTAAPCVTICPVTALSKRADGVIDVDPAACIGCKSCMQACPYDALYINEDTGTAQKCHFCVHRTEVGLAPACAVVCPTEAIIPGDFHDPESRVSKMRAAGGLKARKTEAGTGPNVFYRDVSDAGIDPSLTNTSTGSIWSQVRPGIQLEAQAFERQALEEAERQAQARTTYDVAHAPLWGWKVSAYLFTKSLAAGAFLASVTLLPSWGEVGGLTARAAVVASGLGLFFLFLTAWLLIADLKRPERFLFIMLRPNWTSWLVKGGMILGAYGGLLSLWLAVLHFDWLSASPLRGLLAVLTGAGATLTAMYTAWLFGQAKGRVLWLWKGLAGHFFVQALAGGLALLLLAAPLLDLSAASQQTLSRWLLVALVGHYVLTALKGKFGVPHGREKEYGRAVRLITDGPFAQRHRLLGTLGGVVLPIVLIILVGPGVGTALAGLAALVGLWSEEDILVRAGQALPIS